MKSRRFRGGGGRSSTVPHEYTPADFQIGRVYQMVISDGNRDAAIFKARLAHIRYANLETQQEQVAPSPYFRCTFDGVELMNRSELGYLQLHEPRVPDVISYGTYEYGDAHARYFATRPNDKILYDEDALITPHPLYLKSAILMPGGGSRRTKRGRRKSRQSNRL